MILLQIYNDNSSYSSDSYSKYASNPANKHDDSKLRDKFGTTQLPRSPDHTVASQHSSTLDYPDGRMIPVGERSNGRPVSTGSKTDPYKFTRSTAKPYKTATIDKSKLSDLSAKYRYSEMYVHACLHGLALLVEAPHNQNFLGESVTKTLKLIRKNTSTTRCTHVKFKMRTLKVFSVGLK